MTFAGSTYAKKIKVIAAAAAIAASAYINRRWLEAAFTLQAGVGGYEQQGRRQ